MTALERIAEELGVNERWVEKGGAHWLNPGTLTVRDIAHTMNASNARFVTVTAYQLPDDEGFRLEYHWDLDGQLVGFPLHISGDSIESIYDLCEAADWIEREIHEGFAINFRGREYEPLLLRQGDKPGVNLREEVR
jgi:NADH:ubiquinone oxidoreductase subunit C